MSTIFIYDQCGEQPISFFIDPTEKDYSHLNNQYVNGCDDAIADEITTITEGEKITEFPMGALDHDTSIVVIGFLP